MTLVRWNPARELASMEIDRLNRMFEDFYGQARAWTPAVDIFETNAHEYVIKAELPEMKREDIAVTFEQNVLTISGERKASFERPAGPGSDLDNGLYHRSERAHGKFSRSFTLPATVDGARISATYKDGVLTVRIPQREEAKPKTITVDAE
jgi:HSP20 family protein